MPLPRLGCGGPTRDMTPSGLVEDSATKVKPHAIVTVEKESKQNQDQATAPCLAEVVINADEDNSTQSKTFASLLTKIATKKPSTEDIKPDRLSTSQGTQSPFDHAYAPPHLEVSVEGSCQIQLPRAVRTQVNMMQNCRVKSFNPHHRQQVYISIRPLPNLMQDQVSQPRCLVVSRTAMVQQEPKHPM